MTPSNLCPAHDNLILDASVLINVLGTGRPELVLQALSRRMLMDEVALREVTVDPFTGKSPAALLDHLRSSGLIEVISMDEAAYEFFIGFTGADPPDDLDDGEAATLAQAACHGFVAVIDEKKATRIAGVSDPQVEILTSMDILTAPEMLLQHGQETLLELLFLALRNARMRVPHNSLSWVIDALGRSRVEECPSLGARR